MAPPKTTLIQQSNVVLQTDGTQRFEILSSLSYVHFGDLPHPDVFVHQIVVTNNPKVDKFLRVAQIGDLTSLPRGRDKALSQGAVQYLASSCLISYDTVTVAAAAKKILQARVDDLISQWITYTVSFVVPGEFELPLVAPSIVNAAKATYNTAKTTRITKDAAKDLAQADFDTKSDLATRAATDLTDALTRQAYCAQIQSLLATVVGGETTFRAAVTSFLSVTTDTTNKPSLQTAANAELSGTKPAIDQLNTAITTECANEAAAVTTTTTAKTTADNNLASAQTALTVAQAEATQAAADEAAALAALLDVCPDFVP
jgi:hypothetical protein